MAARANDIDTVKELYPELEQILHELQERLSGMEYK
jgi:hypothetical protein